METIPLKYRPPRDWEKRLQKLARDAHLEINMPLLVGDKLIYNVKPLLPLPGVPMLPPEERITVFRTAVMKMLEDPTLPRDTDSSTFDLSDFLNKPSLVGMGVLLAALGLGCVFLYNETRTSYYQYLAFSLLFLAVLSILKPKVIQAALELFTFAFPFKTSELTQQTLRRQEELFNRLSAAQNDSASGSKELPKTTLIFRANSARDDQARIWRRSTVSFFLGCMFFLLSLAGPIAGYILVRDGKAENWQHLIPNISFSVLMLTAAATLLRYDSKLREHYQAKSDEVAYLDRLQLAIDSARAISDTTYKKTLRKIITQLVTTPPSLVASNRPLSPEPNENQADDFGGVTGKVLDASAKVLDAVNRVVKKTDT